MIRAVGVLRMAYLAKSAAPFSSSRSARKRMNEGLRKDA
jgi:hypothetical protein